MASTAADIETKLYTEEEVEKHNCAADCWVILGEKGQEKVYDITNFLDDHPGGPDIILDLAGKNAQDEFEDIAHSMDAKNMLKKFEVGVLKQDPKALAKALEAKKAAENAKPAGNSDSQESTSWLRIISILVLLVALFYKYGQ